MRKNMLLVGEWKIRDRASVEIEIDQTDDVIKCSSKLSTLLFNLFKIFKINLCLSDTLLSYDNDTTYILKQKQ